VLSSTSDHALRAILLLARHRGGRALRAEQIARDTGAPRNYMAKTLNALVKAGLLTSSRGPAGGFVLACDPDTITIARVIACFDEARPQHRCLLGSAPCDPRHPCAAHARWAAIAEARRAPLTHTTVADLLAG